MLTCGFGFIAPSDIPANNHRRVSIDSQATSWATTAHYRHLAMNHCAAVFATNLTAYFASKNHPELLVGKSVDDTFQHLHTLIGNGPVIRVAPALRGYCARRGVSLSFQRVRTLSGVRRALQAGQPVGLLLMKHPFSWHWVLAVGYCEIPIPHNVDNRSTTSSNMATYLQIIDGWSSTPRYYRPNKGSWLMWATKYWVRD